MAAKRRPRNGHNHHEQWTPQLYSHKLPPQHNLSEEDWHVPRIFAALALLSVVLLAILLFGADRRYQAAVAETATAERLAKVVEPGAGRAAPLGTPAQHGPAAQGRSPASSTSPSPARTSCAAARIRCPSIRAGICFGGNQPDRTLGESGTYHDRRGASASRGALYCASCRPGRPTLTHTRGPLRWAGSSVPGQSIGRTAEQAYTYAGCTRRACPQAASAGADRAWWYRRIGRRPACGGCAPRDARGFAYGGSCARRRRSHPIARH